jgi:hypothetical protein
MNKEELLHLHMLLVLIRTYSRDKFKDEILTERYDSLEISPSQIHKDKMAHKDALFTLGDEIVSHIHRRKVPVLQYFPEIISTPVAAEH